MRAMYLEKHVFDRRDRATGVIQRWALLPLTLILTAPSPLTYRRCCQAH